MTLIDKIKRIQEDIDDQIECINLGGCIHFAYYLSNQLTKLKIQHSILFMDYRPIDLRYGNFASVSHVAVYVPLIGYIDGEDIFHNIDKPYKRVQKVSLRKLNNFRNNTTWNDSYDTTQNGILLRLIEKHLKS